MDHMDHKVNKPYIIRGCERMDHKKIHMDYKVTSPSNMDHKNAELYGP